MFFQRNKKTAEAGFSACKRLSLIQHRQRGRQHLLIVFHFHEEAFSLIHKKVADTIDLKPPFQTYRDCSLQLMHFSGSLNQFRMRSRTLEVNRFALTASDDPINYKKIATDVTLAAVRPFAC